MEVTPNKKTKLSSRNTQSAHETTIENGTLTHRPLNDCSTPLQLKSLLSYDNNDFSPIFGAATQEVYENLDVGWDWNSPKSKPKPKPKKEPPKPIQSPKPAPSRRYVQKNRLAVNEKVVSQLEKLRDDLRSSDRLKKNNTIKDLEGLFDDDSFDEELVLQSQKIESMLGCDSEANLNFKSGFRKTKSDDCLNESSSSISVSKSLFKTKSASGSSLNSLPRKRPTTAVKLEAKFEAVLDDSFDLALQTFSEPNVGEPKGTKCNSDGSVTMSFLEKIDEFDMQEIEKKRLEALAKLKSKKAANDISPLKKNIGTIRTKSDKPIMKSSPPEISPIKNSPEEIEQKRLAALAKLQAKKKQDVIERNRREALKRLKMNKKKREALLLNIKS